MNSDESYKAVGFSDQRTAREASSSASDGDKSPSRRSSRRLERCDVLRWTILLVSYRTLVDKRFTDTAMMVLSVSTAFHATAPNP